MRIVSSSIFLIILSIFYILTNNIINCQSSTKKTKKDDEKKVNSSTNSFESYKVKYSKKYVNSIHHDQAKDNYQKNVARIHAHNGNKSHSYVQAENHMTDMSHKDVVSSRTGLKRPSKNHTSTSGNEKVKGNIKRVGSSDIGFDEQKHGQHHYVKSVRSIGSLDLRSDFPPIQYQGSCGSCWAFTATALIDNYSYKLGQRTKHSEQFILDCSGAGR